MTEQTAPPPPVADEDARAALAMAVLRVALLPLVVIGRSAVDAPGPNNDRFWPVLAVVAVYALVLVVLHARAVGGRHRPPAWLARAEPAVDLTAIAALTYLSGGPYSETRYAFFALPLVAAFRLRPALTALWAAAAVAVFVGLSLPHPANRSSADVDAIIVFVLFLAWEGAGAVVLAAALGRRDARIRADADERGRLVALAAGAEERERARLAEVLHDDAVQNLLLARQELHDHHRRQDQESYERADAALAMTVDQLRGEIFRMHPYVLEHAGLRAALIAHGESAARRAGDGTEVRVDVVDEAVAGQHAALIVALARELLANAAVHAHASRITLRLHREGDDAVLVVADDGRGFEPARRTEAVAAGHIGLATIQERVGAAAGTVAVESAPGVGTTVTVRLPAAPRGPAIG